MLLVFLERLFETILLLFLPTSASGIIFVFRFVSFSRPQWLLMIFVRNWTKFQFFLYFHSSKMYLQLVNNQVFYHGDYSLLSLKSLKIYITMVYCTDGGPRTVLGNERTDWVWFGSKVGLGWKEKIRFLKNFFRVLICLITF